MRKLVLLAAGLILCASLCGQRAGDEHELEYAATEDFRAVVSDTDLLWALPGDGMSLFNRISRYNFNFISYRSRGLDGRFAGSYLGNLDLSTVTAKYPDYALYGALRVGAPYVTDAFGPSHGKWSAADAAGMTEYGMRISRARRGLSLRGSYSEQRYRAGGRLDYAGGLGGGWYAMVKAQYRAGRDKFIAGVFSESYIFSAGVEKDFGDAGSVSIIYIGACSERGMRSWTVQEAFDLTGDNLYNPVWGWWNGRVRNARVRNDGDHIAAANYAVKRGGTDINLSASYRAGRRSRSGFSWWDARNPYPDHYTNLPSYYDDVEVARELEEEWRGGGGISLVDWERLVRVNADAGGNGAAGDTYIIDERAEDIRSLQAAVSASARVSKEFTINYGVRAGRDASNHHKRVKNLLGAEYILDVDEYTGAENDIRNPGRQVTEGGRFGYDYDMVRDWAAAFIDGSLERGRWAFGFGVGVTFASLHRDGRKESENFPGGKSFGKSRRLEFAPYTLRVSGRYSLSPSHQITTTAFAIEREPAAENIFLAPGSHNTAVDDPRNVFLCGAETGYTGFLSPTVEIGAAAYYTATSHETEIYRYYDDIRGEYSLMPLRDISKRFAGVEAGVKIDITARLRLTAVASFSEYVYTSDPVADIYRDEDMSLTVDGAVSELSGLACSPSPQTMFAVSLRYSIPYSWSLEASFVHADGRYVAVNPVRRMDRIASVASSPESLAEFRNQERLPAASAVNIFVSRRFRVAGCDAFAGLAVNNLLGRRDMVYGGYEQMRIQADGTGINRTFSPFPSKYSYCYPRSFLLTVILNF